MAQKHFIKSKLLAWAAFALVIAMIVMTFMLRGEWWSFIDVFFLFLMAFCHLMAVYMIKVPRLSSQLDTCALVCAILGLVAFLVEYFCNASI